MIELYNESSTISTLQDAKGFIHHAVYALGWVEFHPDDSFSGCKNLELELVPVYDKLLQECKMVFRKEGKDIYQAGLNEVRNYMVKHKM